MAGLAAIAPIALLAGSVVSGAGTILSGVQENAAARVQARATVSAAEQNAADDRVAAEFEAQQANEAAEIEAAQLRQIAQSERAAAGVAARDRRRAGRLLESTQRARAASSGAGVANPTVLGLIEDTILRTSELSRTELFKGETGARQRESQAAATILDADRRGRIGRFNADLRGRTSIANARLSSDILRARGRAGVTTGILSGVGTAATGFAKFKSKATKFG